MGRQWGQTNNNVMLMFHPQHYMQDICNALSMIRGAAQAVESL